ncbi:hypothetical protein YM3MPS_07960 [Mycobacterium pseudoshottsii]|nr:hypothetical protein DL240490_03797 [Mycobacterium marinum]BEH74993.1 hypothetical protein YM3MPS_07960 [Mycobacterium pseudoshottsii]
MVGMTGAIWAAVGPTTPTRVGAPSSTSTRLSARAPSQSPIVAASGSGSQRRRSSPSADLLANPNGSGCSRQFAYRMSSSSAKVLRCPSRNRTSTTRPRPRRSSASRVSCAVAAVVRCPLSVRQFRQGHWLRSHHGLSSVDRPSKSKRTDPSGETSRTTSLCISAARRAAVFRRAVADRAGPGCPHNSRARCIEDGRRPARGLVRTSSRRGYRRR